MSKKYISKNLKQTKEIALKLINEFLGGCNVVLLEGDLGAGKTTFSQFVLESFGAEGPFTSPTFVIMKKYKLSSKVKSEKLKSDSKFNHIYHIDCYRIESEEEISDLGWEEIIADKSNLVLVEWPERISGILPESCIQIKFELKKENERIIRINKKQ